MLSKVFSSTEHMGYFKEHFKNLILTLLVPPLFKMKDC